MNIIVFSKWFARHFNGLEYFLPNVGKNIRAKENCLVKKLLKITVSKEKIQFETNKAKQFNVFLQQDLHQTTKNR